MFVMRCSSFIFFLFFFLGSHVYLLFRWAHFAHDYLCKKTHQCDFFLLWQPNSFRSLSAHRQQISLFRGSFLCSFDARNSEKQFFFCNSFFCSLSRTGSLLLNIVSLFSIFNIDTEDLFARINYAATSVCVCRSVYIIFRLFRSEKWISILKLLNHNPWLFLAAHSQQQLYAELCCFLAYGHIFSLHPSLLFFSLPLPFSVQSLMNYD